MLSKRVRERERACVCMCVCVCERDRERERDSLYSNHAQAVVMSCKFEMLSADVHLSEYSPFHFNPLNLTPMSLTMRSWAAFYCFLWK